VVLRTLGDLGFHDIAWRVLDSKHFGVPQRRRRVFIVARRADGDLARKVLLEPESSGRDSQASREERQDDPRTFGQSVAEDSQEAVSIAQNQRGEVRESDVALSLTKGGGKPGEGYSAARIGAMVRRLTPTECERLQGFPDGWTIQTGPSLRHALSWYQQENPDPAPVDVKPDGPRYAAMGDAVTVPVIEWLGQRLLERGQ
jgi:DNA (cytosine-5)-methyltransferase 1